MWCFMQHLQHGALGGHCARLHECRASGGRPSWGSCLKALGLSTCKTGPILGITVQGPGDFSVQVQNLEVSLELR